MTFSPIEARRPPRNALAVGPGASSWLGVRVTLFRRPPGLFGLARCSRLARSTSRSVLEVGCGDRPMPGSFPMLVDMLRFAIQRHPNGIYYAGPTFSMADETFDSLFHTEVPEHVY